MHTTRTIIRGGVAIAVASLLAGCVEPAYVVPGPIQLQQYPPAVSYQSAPDYRPPVSGPIPLQSAPIVEPLPPPIPAPTVTEVPPDDLGGAIPVQDMPAPASDSALPTTGAAPDQAATSPASPGQTVQKAPTTTAGKNVPLEGFRPMHGQTRPAP